MDFQVIFLKVLIIHMVIIYEIFVLLLKVRFIFNHWFLLILIVALGWNKEKFSFIGHSYGAVLAMAVKSYFFSVIIIC
jgi:hypothetical protein